MKQYFLNLIAFDHWANSKLLVALAGASSLPARAPAVFSHLLASTQVWHARLVGQEVRVPVWPEWAPAVWPAELAANATRMEQYLHGLAEGDFGQPVQYTNTKGEAFKTSVSDILTHLLTHASYHQGQLVALLKGSVVPLPDIIYISYVRQLAALHSLPLAPNLRR